MFRTLIYFDEKRVLEYKSLIERKKAVAIRNVKITNEKSGKAQISILSGGIAGKSEMDGEVLENYLLDCEEFENLLEERDDYFDFTEEDYDLETISRSSIIRFNATFNIPHEFDMIDLVNQFRPMLIKGVDIESKEEAALLKSILGKESTKIPIFIESDELLANRLGYSKINSNYLCCSLNSIEDYENDEVTIIAKVISKRDVNNRPIVVYDIMKDLFSMSRSLRRQFMDSKIDGVENIEINENFVTLEILAIYQ